VIAGGVALVANIVTTAVTIKVRGGKVSATGGPFIETKEDLGGFIVLTPSLPGRPLSDTAAGNPGEEDFARR